MDPTPYKRCRYRAWPRHHQPLLGFVEREEILATSHFLGHVHHELAVILSSLAQMPAEFAQIPRILARTPPNVFARWLPLEQIWDFRRLCAVIKSSYMGISRALAIFS